ncbi:MAG: lysophospholipid acyltransferase family protein [Myxococcota bacterium]|jgi:1-acyl-sn-glycerol-3-phosphate acyltransferase|nr:lysophospholipid acyltransferase family protein [Myxococcota bacterium]
MALLSWIAEQRELARQLHGHCTALDWLKSAGLWGASLAWSVPVLSGLTVLSAKCGVPAHRLQPLNRRYVKVQLALLGVDWSAEVDPGVLAEKPYIFVQNHVNHFDFIICHNATPHYRQGLEREDHFRYPLYGPFMRHRGTIPVRKGESAQLEGIRERIREELLQGRSLLVFPEGTRTRDGRLGRFRRGIFVIARELRVPVVPVAVSGMRDLMCAGSVLLKPGAKVQVRVGAPRHFADLEDEALDAAITELREWMMVQVDLGR